MNELRDTVAACFADGDTLRTYLEAFARARGLQLVLPQPPAQRKALVEAALQDHRSAEELVEALMAERSDRREDLAQALASWRASLKPDPSASKQRLETLAALTHEKRLKGQDCSAEDAELGALLQVLGGGPLLPGAVLDEGRYRLARELGHGAFARIWLAWDQEQGAEVVLKALREERARDASARERLFAGARRMAELDHPHIVRIHRAHVETDGLLYLVMEYCPGGDLERAVFERRLGAREALLSLVPVASALAFAHARGVIHRDVKPHNVLLTATLQPKLADFDLSKGVGAEALTLSTEGLGSMIYAAPEQQQGGGQVDARADVYGLGMTAVFCARGKALDVAVLHEREAAIRNLPLPEPTRDVLRRATALRAEDRFVGAEAFAEALTQSFSIKIEDSSTPLISESYKSTSRKYFIIVPVLGLCAAALAWVLRAPDPVPEPETPPPDPVVQPTPLPPPDLPEVQVPAPAPLRDPLLRVGPGSWTFVNASSEGVRRSPRREGFTDDTLRPLLLDIDREYRYTLTLGEPGRPGYAYQLHSEGPDVETAREDINNSSEAKQLVARGPDWCLLFEDGQLRCKAGSPGLPQPNRYAAIDMGIDLACGVELVSGRILCDNPELGSGPLSAERFMSLAVGSGFVCGLTEKAQLRCFGRAPLREPPAQPMQALTASGDRLCALDTDGKISCWGKYKGKPMQSPTGQGYTSIDMENDLICGLRAEGAVRCRDTKGEEQCSQVNEAWTCELL